MDRLSSFGMLILRLIAGLTMMPHGWAKACALFSGSTQDFNPIGIGTWASLALSCFAELPCAALVAAGLYARWAAAILALNMCVAVYYLIHINSPFFPNTVAAFLYLGIFMAIAFKGAGSFSIDGILQKQRKIES